MTPSLPNVRAAECVVSCFYKRSHSPISLGDRRCRQGGQGTGAFISLLDQHQYTDARLKLFSVSNTAGRKKENGHEMRFGGWSIWHVHVGLAGHVP
jgi:hypothetical protein